MSVQTIEVLRSLGFREGAHGGRDVMPGTLTFSFAGFELDALECIGKHFGEVVLMTGVASTHQRLSLIEFELPEEVESPDQGVAWLVYMLDRQARAHLADDDTIWLEQGRRHVSTLPWERSRQAYTERPMCMATRDWMRPAIRAIRAAVTEASEADSAVFAFDGEVLKISCGGQVVAAVPADGAAWDREYRVRAKALQRLPGRLMNPWIEISIWDDRLSVARHAFSLVEHGNDSGEAEGPVQGREQHRTSYN